MINVCVSNQTAYPVNTNEIKKRISKFLLEKGVASGASVDVAIVGKKEMAKIASKYLKEDNVIHNVLSFPDSESKGQFVYPQEGLFRLGEIVICYSKVLSEAKLGGVMPEERLYDLIEHGAKHLVGEHHK